MPFYFYERGASFKKGWDLRSLDILLGRSFSSCYLSTLLRSKLSFASFIYEVQKLEKPLQTTSKHPHLLSWSYQERSVIQGSDTKTTNTLKQTQQWLGACYWFTTAKLFLTKECQITVKSDGLPCKEVRFSLWYVRYFWKNIFAKYISEILFSVSKNFSIKVILFKNQVFFVKKKPSKKNFVKCNRNFPCRYWASIQVCTLMICGAVKSRSQNCKCWLTLLVFCLLLPH